MTRKRRLWAFVLAVALLLSCVPAFPAGAGAEAAWDGVSKSEPTLTDGYYQIANGAQLAWFAEATKTQPQINAVLTEDIDLGGQLWEPIGIAASGYVTESFAGVFDGQGHAVSGLHIATDKAFYGLFYCVYGGTVRNVRVSGDVATTGNTAGGIVGKLQGGTIENCLFSGSVTAAKNYVGGIVGNIVSNSKTPSVIVGCCNSGAINGKYAGGILGYTTAKAEIRNCYNTGTITGTTRSAGISGQQTAGSIAYCYNIGASASGVCGFSNAAITSCFYLHDETAEPGGTATGYQKIADAPSLLAHLNAGADAAFADDTAGINGGYPLLSWQTEKASGPVINEEDVQKVEAALAMLSLDTFIKEPTTLALPTEIGGCAVTWTSSRMDLITDAGVATLPEGNQIVTVTLTATAALGNASGEKSFDIDVWPKEMDAEEYLATVLDAMKWNFKQLQPVYGEDTNIIVKFQNLLRDKGYDGVTVTINETDDAALISQTGKIGYPELPEGSFADGKQVTVSFSLTVDGKTAVYPEGNANALLIPWDLSPVRESLETSADVVLAESELCGSNPSLDSVATDLVLPSCIRSGASQLAGKYGFAWITWESSDEGRLAISDELRTGSADALYNPYVGKVRRGTQPADVTLTATVTNPSTGLSVRRTFAVTVNPLSEGEVNRTLDQMASVLDCYTVDKLADSATGAPLNPNAVCNDIQLVIPREVVTPEELTRLAYGKYWDYWNYRFTVESSDTDVIEVNGFRAYVYRPLGEDAAADRQVTLTVRMAGKTNPDFYVEKDITVTVKHLSRSDINAQLELMDRAKTCYADGLLGDNADPYSVIDDLAPYWGMVWNNDRTGVDFVRTNAEKRGDGVIVDTLPGWEEQEDWRLFHTSDRERLSNETLLLNGTPDEDTFVKIESVLTDETLGKYYTKFRDDKDYDPEALAKFKQLYKQPVSAYVMLVGANGYTAEFAATPFAMKAAAYLPQLTSFKLELDRPVCVTFTLLGLDGAPMIAKTTEDSFTKGATVFDVFKKALKAHGMNYTAKGSYVSSVNGLTELDYGANSGWMYSVDGVFVNSYMSAQELADGDDIVVKYVRDYRTANRPDGDHSGEHAGDRPNTGNNGGGTNGESGSANGGGNAAVGNNSGIGSGMNAGNGVNPGAGHLSAIWGETGDASVIGGPPDDAAVFEGMATADAGDADTETAFSEGGDGIREFLLQDNGGGRMDGALRADGGADVDRGIGNRKVVFLVVGSILLLVFFGVFLIRKKRIG